MSATEMDSLIETAFRGPGRVESISLCVSAYDIAATAGPDRAACHPIRSEGRVRIYAGAFSLVAPWKDQLVLTVPEKHAATELLLGLGAEREEGPKRHPDLAVLHAPRPAVAPHTGLLLTGLAAAAAELAAASRCPRRHDDELERALRAIARQLN